MIDIDKEIPSDGRPRWIIIDDLMSELDAQIPIENLFTKGSHHKNIS
jgi:hypothetical protein